MNLINKANDKVLAAAAFLVAVSATSASAEAVPTTTGGTAASIGDALDKGSESAKSLFNAGVVVAAAVGIWFVFMGALALKKANDTDGQQVSYKQGGVQITIGVVLLALGGFIAMIAGTFGLDTTDQVTAPSFTGWN